MRIFRNKRIIQKTKFFFRSEKGQSMVEFALILPILLALMLVPVDFYRFISLQSQLNNAAVDGLNYVQYENIKGGNYQNTIIHAIDAQYGKKINVDEMKFVKLETSGNTTEYYTYYVYSTDKTGGRYQDHFDERPASYEHCTLTTQLSYQMKPITFWGKMFFGDSCEVKSKEVSREVYSGGFVSDP